MKSSNTLFMIMVVILAISYTLSFAKPTYNEPSDVNMEKISSNNNNNDDIQEEEEASSLRLRGPSRFLATHKVRTCDKYPTICSAKGSQGQHCCNKQCVNVMTDKFNCGKCGKKCGYSKMCCQGKCVNVSVDDKNCGSCNKKCEKGSSCTYGMCSYA